MAAAMVLSMSSTWIGGSAWLWARRGRDRAVDGSEDLDPLNERVHNHPREFLMEHSRAERLSLSASSLPSSWFSTLHMPSSCPSA